METSLQFNFNNVKWPYLQVVVLPLLLRLEVEPGQPAQVLLAHRLVHSGTAADALPVVVGRVGPPVSLGFDVAEDHVLDGGGQAGHLGAGKRNTLVSNIQVEEPYEERPCMAFINIQVG